MYEDGKSRKYGWFNKIANWIIKKAIKKCRIRGDISKVTYHRLNLGTDGQDTDKFETMRNSKTM